MLSTLPDSYSKQADIHLKLSVQPYHLIPRSPLLICYQMSDQNVGKWKRQQLKMSSFLGNYNHATVSANHPTKWKDVAQFAPERYLLIHHLAAESRKKKKKDVIFLTFPPRDESNGFLVWLSFWVFLRRLYFTLKKKAPAMSVTVSPCDLPIEWSLAARTLKDKPLKSLQCEWTGRPQPALYPEDHHCTWLSQDDQLDIIITTSQI